MGYLVGKGYSTRENRVYVVRNHYSTDGTPEEKGASILILGAPNSGKYTLFKQMIIIHKSGYWEDQR